MFEPKLMEGERMTLNLERLRGSSPHVYDIVYIPLSTLALHVNDQQHPAIMLKSTNDAAWEARISKAISSAEDIPQQSVCGCACRPLHRADAGGYRKQSRN